MCMVLNKSEQILMLHSLKIIHILIIIGHAGARCLKITVCITFIFKGDKTTMLPLYGSYKLHQYHIKWDLAATINGLFMPLLA